MSERTTRALAPIRGARAGWRMVCAVALAAVAACTEPNPAFFRAPAMTASPPRPRPETSAGSADAAIPAAHAPEMPTVPSPDAAAPDAAAEPTTDASSDGAPMLARSVLMVVGSLTLEPMDAQLRTHLQGLGYSVAVALDQDSVAGDADAHDVVFISGSVFSDRLGEKFRDVAVPVVCNDSWAFPAMRLTGPASASDWGRDDADAPPDARIRLQAVHPLGANLDGTRTVSDRPIGLAWGRPLPGAISVASLVGNSARMTIFGYPAGVPLFGGSPAPARRVGSFVRHPNGARLTPDGLLLLEAAITWAIAR